MKRNVRNALAISGLAITIGATGLTLNASADTGRQNGINRSHQERILHTAKTERWDKTAGIRRVIPGVVTENNGSTLTITQGSKTYAVSTSAGARLLNGKWTALSSLSDIRTGDKVRVLGTISGTTITAKTIRDISL